MTVKEIVIKYLKNEGYDGLCGDDCGCLIDDLFLCGPCFSDCRPGWKCNLNTEKMNKCHCSLGNGPSDVFAVCYLKEAK